MKKLISVIIPVYNEENSIPFIYDELVNVWNKLKRTYDYEIIFVNDGSEDRSGQIIEHLTADNNKVKYIEFSRNFNKEQATSAGIHHANGDAAIIIDADLQHPVELIPEFLKKWKKGAEIVIGVRENNGYDPLFKQLGSAWFYKIMNIIGDTPITPNATDFRLIDRAVIREFNRFTEKNRMTRGLLDWLGFQKEFVTFQARQRRYGSGRYNYAKLTKLALSTFVTHSLFPLKLAGYLGTTMTLLSGALGLFIFIEKYVLSDPLNLNFSGPAILAVLILFLVGIILICLGLIALYIANIHNEAINRPIYVLRKTNMYEEKM